MRIYMQMKPKNIITRRKFFRNASAGALGLTILSDYAHAVPASDKVIVAHIGLGMMGNGHMKWFSDLPQVEIAALCDVDETRLGEKMDTLKNGEKPLSHYPAEGRAMLQNMNHYNRVFQLGTQIHAGENYHRIVELLRSGVLGKIHTVRLWKPGGSPVLGFPANQTPPNTLDWDMWLGPAPYAEYTPVRCHHTFRYFFDYSGGVFQDFWCHIADLVYWALEPKGLRSIEARGDSPHDGIADTPRWIEVDYEFEGLNIHWTTNPPDLPGAGEQYIGAYFEGSKGSLICDYHSFEITLGGQKIKDIPEVPKTIPRSPGHQQNFIDSIKSRKQPASNLAYVRRMTIPMHLGLISFRLGRKLVWDEKAEHFVGDHAADYLLSRAYRSPWRLS